MQNKIQVNSQRSGKKDKEIVRHVIHPACRGEIWCTCEDIWIPEGKAQISQHSIGEIVKVVEAQGDVAALNNLVCF